MGPELLVPDDGRTEDGLLVRVVRGLVLQGGGDTVKVYHCVVIHLDHEERSLAKP